MNTGISATALSAYFITLTALLVAGFILFTVFKTPVKLVATLVINSILGGLLLFLLNFLFTLFGFTLGVNVFTAVIVGVLGVPGLVMLVVLYFLL